MFSLHPRRLGADGLPERHSVADLLLRTLPGRALVVGAAIRLLASAAQLLVGRTPLLDAVGTVGTLALLAGVVVFAGRLIALARRRLLWRVRRKLILSFIFVGLVPALLIIVFFALCGLLLFSSISSYVVETRLHGLAEQAQFLAQTAAIELSRTPSADLADRLVRKQAALETRFPEMSLALVPVSRTCATETPTSASSAAPRAGVSRPVTAGPWPHLDPPAAVPAWVPCSGFSGLMAYWAGSPESLAALADRQGDARATRDERARTTPAGGNLRLFVRAVAFPGGPLPHYAVVLDMPLNELTAVRLREETGISLRAVSLMSGTGALPMPGREPTSPAGRAPADGATTSALQPTWVVFLEFTDWATGRTGTATLSIVLNVREIYARLSPSRVGGSGLSFGQLLVAIIVLVGVLFLIIQFVALLIGLALARSITGSVHELFVGTERVRQGDFSHRIAVQAKDQLGELADSFNSMIARLSSLLAEMAEKKRLEEELRIARRIQMSLLPQNPPIELPGVTLTAVCQPAREVGGDYYDFLPLEGNRIGLLIADVSGKGTSAALYMAELKGLMLSLTQIHRSPRDLLVAANRIISVNLDSRSFITMTYAVLDLDTRTMTWARAGHTPLIHLPGRSGGERRARILVPDGMVLGLRIDDGERFAASLEEVTIPITGGDLFMFFTDGLSEQMNNADDLFGESRLGAIIEQHGSLPPDELRERILREVHAFADGAPQHDDMTFILLRVDDLRAPAAERTAHREAVLV
jgi:serine phosphatase RsbU (regulator of sigma subunit)